MADYAVKLSGPDLNFESSIDKDRVLQIIQVCMTNFQPATQVSAPLLSPVKTERPTVETTLVETTLVETPPSNVRPAMSIAEYYRQFNPKRNPDKILCFASYTKHVLGKESFDPEEIKEMFKKVGEITPKNYMRDLRWAVTNGWLDKCSDSNELYVTLSGEKTLESDFHPDILKKTKSPDAKRKSKRKTKTAEPDGDDE